MSIAAKIHGGPGTGKTTALLDTMSKILQTDVQDPTRIGFVSFTRAARENAASRAAEQFGVNRKDLEAEGWFRTLHSCAYRCLGVDKDELLTGTKADNDWLQGELGERLTENAGRDESDPDLFSQETDAGKALSIWSVCRNRLEPFDVAYKRVVRRITGSTYLSQAFCEKLIDRYEQAKMDHGRLDFTDMLLRFAGIQMTTKGSEQVPPQGWVPAIPAWFADEWQDCSALQKIVFNRLTEKSRWLYLVADERQAIHSYAGADPKIFREWPAAKERTLPKSFRCGKNIWDLAERIAKRMSDFRERGIEPADHDGNIRMANLMEIASIVKPPDKWLCLARTNWLLTFLASRLKESGIPFRYAKAKEGPTKITRAVAAIIRLESGDVIDGKDWANIIEIIPAKYDGQELLVRGTKTRFEEPGVCDSFGFETLASIEEMGATPFLRSLIEKKQWGQVLKEDAKAIERQARKYGPDLVDNPTIRLGTIHSAKGLEEDNVFLFDGVTPLCQKNLEGPSESRDEEHRVWYVAATRARHCLVVATDRRVKSYGVR